MSRMVTFILVDPENPDNIGAVARAMKNMGLQKLRLVRPPLNWKENAKKMAVSAYDVLEKAKVYDAVENAMGDMQLVIGTTRRAGPRRGAFIPFDEIIEKVKEQRKTIDIAIMFGRESKGLDNQSLNYCDWVMTIPVHPGYPSINLAQAVMIVAFSIFDKSTKLPRPVPKRGRYKEQDEMEPLEPINFVAKNEIHTVLDRLEFALKKLDYDGPGNKTERIRQCFHRLFKRNGLLASEAEMFKGLSRRISEKS